MIVIKILSVIALLVGVILLVAGISAYSERQAFLARAQPASGVIIGIERETSSMSGRTFTSFYYRVRYATQRGDSLEFRTAEGSSSPEYSISETVPILYAPDNPQQAVINTFGFLWGSTGVLLIVGGSLLGIGGCNLWITAVPARKKIRTIATLPELFAAYRAGRLTRDSEYQGLLVAFTIVGFGLLAISTSLLLFAPLVLKLLIATLLTIIAFQIARSSRTRKPA